VVLADSKGAAPIYIDRDGRAYDGLSLIGPAVAGDIEAVSGQRPKVYAVPTAATAVNTVHQDSGVEQKTLGNESVIIIAGLITDQLIKNQGLTWSITASEDSFQHNDFERYQIQVKADGNQTRVVVAGADKRGTIYGLFHITQDLCGVSPWIWWADSKPVHQDTLSFSKTDLECVSKRPSVNYRGFFLNDENPCLDGFADSHFGGLNYMFYDQVFELMLRLKGNYLWPAMWSNDFNRDGMEGVTGDFATLEKQYHHKLGGVMYVDTHNQTATTESGTLDINTLSGKKIGDTAAGAPAHDTGTKNNNDASVGYMVEGEYPMALANAVLADRYGVVIGFSHHEPMARSGREWGIVKHQYYNSKVTSEGKPVSDPAVWNYLLNPTNIYNFWSDAIARNGNFDNLLTIGMRGENDSALKDENNNELTIKQNSELLKKVIKDQAKILQNFDLSKTPQVLVLYKEVENCWYGGSRNDPSAVDHTAALREDTDITGLVGKDTNSIVMLCEDNNGYLRTLPEVGEENKFNWGMYYHFDYVGGPRTSMWLNTMPLQRTWENMTAAYERGVDDAWIVNVGDLKPMELPLSYFLDMAYDYETYGTGKANTCEQYTLNWVKQQFKAGNLSDQQYQQAAQLLTDYTDLNGDCKPETLLSSTYSTVNYNEAQRQLARANSIITRVEELANSVDAFKKGGELYDAFYQLVYYPAVASANVNRIQLLQGLNQLYAERSSMLANVYAELVKEYLDLDNTLSVEYNKLGGKLNNKEKWYGMMWTSADPKLQNLPSLDPLPSGKKTQPHINYIGWNAESSVEIVPTTVAGAAGAMLMVDVPGDAAVYTDGATAVMPDFESTEKQTYALTLSNGGAEALDYEIDNVPTWIKLEGDQTGRFYTGKVLSVSVDWDNVTTDQQDTFTVSANSQTVNVKVTAKVIKTDVVSEEKVYFPSHGEISIPANGFATNTSANNSDSTSVTWTELKGYGKMGTTMKMLPTAGESFTAGNGPSLTYKAYVENASNYTLTLYVGQSNNVSFDKGKALNVGVKVNDATVTTVDTLPEKYIAGDGGYGDWGNTIIKAGRTVNIPLSLNQGVNTLTLYGMDHNLLLQKLVLTPGANTAPKTSHTGPEATFATGQTVTQKPLICFDKFREIMTLPGTLSGGDYKDSNASGALNAEANKTYTYPVQVTAAGNCIFYIDGKSDSNAKATLTLDGKSVTVDLTSTKAVTEGSPSIELTPGKYDLTLTVTGNAEITSIVSELYDATEGRKVTLSTSDTGASNTDLEKVMDRKKSTGWTPTVANPTVTLALDTDTASVNADWFTLTGSFSNVTDFKLESSDDNKIWTTVYAPSTKPVSGRKVWFHDTKAYTGKYWKFSFTGTVDMVDCIMKLDR